MTRKFSRLFGWQAFWVLAFLVSSCGGSGGSADGDATDDCGGCPEGLECVAEECVCVVAGCCFTSEDCQPGYICNRDEHRCERSSPDGDLIDGDGDQDVDTDTDTEDEIIDGDTPQDGDEDGDETQPDGDADGDIPVDRTCMWGVEKMLRVEDLPLFERQALTRQYSSRDPAEANNDMRPEGLFLDGAQDQVLLHSKVPGCVYRMWFAEPAMIGSLRLKIYFDGESTPSVNMMITDFFNNTDGRDPVYPFVQPLVGMIGGPTRGAYYSYVPICWSEEIKIVFSSLSTGDLTKGWQITFQEHPDCPDIETFNMDLDVSELVSFVTDHIGEDPKPTEGNEERSFSRPLNAGATLTVYEQYINDGEPGRSINAMFVDIAGANDDILNNTWLEIYWDGKDTMSEPDVEAPIGLFFGSGYGEVDWASMMMGMSTTGEYYSYWPMPFWRSVIIRAVNRSQSNIAQLDFRFQIGPNPYPKGEAGHFRARYHEEIPTTAGSDFIALEDGGKGRVVGISMAMEPITGTGNNAFLNGDERFYIDGMAFPILRGTGTDNFFNGHYLWSAVVGGYQRPWFSLWKDTNYHYSARRLFIGDSIPFNQSVTLGFEHGGTNADDGYYRSVVYYYSSCLAGMQLTDEVCFGVASGQACSETSHNMTITLESNLDLHKNVPGAYEGQNHATQTTDSGRGIMSVGSQRGLMSVTVAIDPQNEGVRLVRKLSHKLKSDANRLARQSARVLVGPSDSEISRLSEAGFWYTPGINHTLPWKESVFDIPPSLTAGKDSIKIAFEHTGEQAEWNVFNLWVYSLLPPGQGGEGPGKVETINYQMVGLKPCLSWNVPQGVPPALYHIYRSDTQAFNCEDLNFVATTSDSQWCEPQDLEAQSEFFYRVVAEDCTGTRGVCSDKLRVYTGAPPVCFEAEDAYDAEQSTGPEGAYTERSNPAYSGNKLVEYQTTAANQLLVLTHNVEYSATYVVQITVLKGPNMGIFRMLVGGNPLSNDNQDLYSSEDTLEVLTFGPISISSGEKMFRFRVQDAVNPASGGRHIGVDKICLIGTNEEEEK